MFNFFKKKSTLKSIEPDKKAISLKKEEADLGEQLLNSVINHDGPVTSGLDRYSFSNSKGLEFEIKQFMYTSGPSYMIFINHKSVDELIDKSIQHTIYSVLEEKHKAYSEKLRKLALDEARKRLLDFVK